MKLLQEFLDARLANSNELLFPSPQNTALRATNVLKEALHPVLEDPRAAKGRAARFPSWHQ